MGRNDERDASLIDRTERQAREMAESQRKADEHADETRDHPPSKGLFG